MSNQCRPKVCFVFGRYGSCSDSFALIFSLTGRGVDGLLRSSVLACPLFGLLGFGQRFLSFLRCLRDLLLIGVGASFLCLFKCGLCLFSRLDFLPLIERRNLSIADLFDFALQQQKPRVRLSFQLA